MKIETDLKHIEQMGKVKDDENVEFRTFLKTHDMSTKELDAVVHQIAAEVSAQIDCTKCANCCKKIHPTLEKDDIAEFALGLNVSTPKFTGTYLKLHDKISETYEFNGLPCPFLQDDRCSNYEHRPKDCRSYPHLHKDNFTSRLWGVISNYSICPIVFNTYEQLKAELWVEEY